MKILIFDSETTGLPNYNERARHPSQPHIVELSALLYTDTGEKLSEYTALSKPDGWVISPEMTAIHGISHAQACMHGISEKAIAEAAFKMIREADIIAAHNLMFDKFIVRCALRRYEIMTDADDEAWKSKRGVCTMREMTPHCKLPGLNGNHKYPKLIEAYRHAFKADFDGAHSALADCLAACRLFFWLKNSGHIQLKELDLAQAN